MTMCSHLMDRLANGFSFSNAHCPAPICGPSRTAILTGMRPVTSGVYDNNVKLIKIYRMWLP